VADGLLLERRKDSTTAKQAAVSNLSPASNFRGEAQCGGKKKTTHKKTQTIPLPPKISCKT